MRQSLLKVLALILTIGVIAFVIHVSRQDAREPDARAAQASASAAAASAKDAGVANTPPPQDTNKYGVLGPATKADPHTVRRAVESLVPAPSSSQVAP